MISEEVQGKKMSRFDTSHLFDRLEEFKIEYKLLRKKVQIITVIGIIFPITIFILELPFHFLIDGLSIPKIRFLIFLIMICFALLLTIYFSHVRIKKPVMIKEATKNLSKNDYLQFGWIVIFHSHHSDDLKNHELKLGNRMICSGCFGTVIGLAIAQIFGIAYLFFIDNHSIILGLVFFVIGALFVSFTFIKYHIKISGILRLFFNSSIMIGISLLLIGSDLFFNNIYSAIFLAVIIVPIFYLRRKIVQLDHKSNEMMVKIDKKIVN